MTGPEAESPGPFPGRAPGSERAPARGGLYPAMRGEAPAPSLQGEGSPNACYDPPNEEDDR